MTPHIIHSQIPTRREAPETGRQNPDMAPETLLHEPLASLKEELSRISSEIQSINSGFQAEVERAIANERIRMENEFQMRLQEQVSKVRAQMSARLHELQRESDRVSKMLHVVTEEIAAMIEDPLVELSRVMRMKAEESVLRAYLDGLRFSTAPATEPPEAAKS